MRGEVTEALPNTTFKVVVKDQIDQSFICYLAGKMRLNHINVVIGDKVEVVMAPDLSRGRIIKRL